MLSFNNRNWMDDGWMLGMEYQQEDIRYTNYWKTKAKLLQIGQYDNYELKYKIKNYFCDSWSPKSDLVW